ncbi:MAG: Rid family detoxifying hydrolase [Bacteroidia bacterium]|nr:Rid family detoxifying hydrolase [Bacteroidia bacterium]
MKSVFFVLCYLFFGISTSVAQDVTPKPIAPYTPAVMVNGTLYLSGQIPRVPDTGELIKGDIKKATEQCMKNIGVLLKQNDLGFEDLVMVNIYMTDMDNYKAINDSYAPFFKNQKFPARAAVQVVRLPMDAEVEISGIAVKRN